MTASRPRHRSGPKTGLFYSNEDLNELIDQFEARQKTNSIPPSGVYDNRPSLSADEIKKALEKICASTPIEKPTSFVDHQIAGRGAHTIVADDPGYKGPPPPELVQIWGQRLGYNQDFWGRLPWTVAALDVTNTVGIITAGLLLGAGLSGSTFLFARYYAFPKLITWLSSL